MNEEFRALVEQVKESVTVFDAMRLFGEWEGVDTTKQVKCNFHGPDTTPSARVYLDTGLMYCFACPKLIPL